MREESGNYVSIFCETVTPRFNLINGANLVESFPKCTKIQYIGFLQYTVQIVGVVATKFYTG